MKFLLPIIISSAGAIALNTIPLMQAASAQMAETMPVDPTPTQSELLRTEPVSANHQQTVQQSMSSLNSDRLKNVANSIHSKPVTEGATGGIPSNLIPKDLFRTPSKPLSETHPLEPFQAPPPNPSFGINLNGL